jgi:hypothetical protein
MTAVNLDRQAIERRDFPIGRRGYDTAAVDAHLRALAAEFDELKRSASGGAEGSLAATASSQVQSIISAAETAAAEIERQAQEHARRARDDAERDAARTRDEAVDKARAHVAAVSQATATLLERVGSMDGEVGALIESLRGGATRLAQDLTAVKTGMGELYDSASGARASTPAPGLAEAEPEAATEPEGATEPEATPAPQPAATPTVQPESAPEASAPQAADGAQEPPAEGASGDLDGARLIALNMALNGESRAETDRYLAENFQLPDRAALVDEVYAAIEA